MSIRDTIEANNRTILLHEADRLFGAARIRSLNAEEIATLDAAQRAGVNKGQMREVLQEDQAGRRISHFYGESDWMEPFKRPGLSARLNTHPRAGAQPSWRR